MTAKKKWTSLNLSQVQPYTDENDISWSSDDETSECSAAKKSKCDHVNKPNKMGYSTPPHIAEDDINNLNESPVLRTFTRKVPCSPILVPFTIFREPSPILGQSESMLLELKRKINEQKYQIEDDFCSPPCATQSSFFISDSQSSEGAYEDLLQISQTSIFLSPVDIDPDASQESTSISSSISISRQESSSSSSTASNCSSNTVKKIKCRKGGIGEQLQKALHAQRSSLAFWEHEQFLARIKCLVEEQDEASVVFCIIEKRTEYGCHRFKCKSDGSDEEFELIGNVSETNIGKLCEGLWYKMFKPYSSKVINSDVKQQLFYYNCQRFIKINAKK